ncbi:hypothetical protein [Rhodococcus sp. T7]|uniref:hypothetical protein n=1 Tax=Rhodococcus sp. T7 TaxID=627444 RepID=UPI001359CF1B|nr:hypothetical protein [Rhodococcus sp. T7]KAF0957818.1 hypothetical protein MLGJGCBP_09650 [Rhodococcus sp. T7]KAF0961529.1 hypothetical protein MLGJGCBP_05409 [Rhodococcus sp. T7]
MRPTIDEQLTGAARLLRLVEHDPETPLSVGELVRNARRLVDRVGESWSRTMPFLRDDNARLAVLLGADEPEPGDLAETIARNEKLRGELTSRIHELPAGPARAQIGAHLRNRVATNPT